MKTAAICLVLFSALATPLAAQDSPLIVKTSSREVATSLSTQFGSLEPLPSVEAGGHYVLTLGGNGISVATGSGDVGLMQIDARPGPLMEMFSDQIKQYQGMAQALAVMSLSQQGIKPGEAMGMIQAVLDFPNQVESLGLRIDGDPDALEQGFTAELSLAPVGQTWFASLVDALAPVSAGAPVFDVGGAMRASFALGMKTVEPLVPFMKFISAMGSGSGEEQQKRLEMIQKSLDIMTGSAAMGWDLAGGGMQVIATLKDPDAMRELMNDPAYAEWTTSSMGGVAGMEVDYQPAAFEHRGVKVSKMTVDMGAMAGGMANPILSDGKFQSFYAVAGDYSLTSTYATSDASIKQLIDSVLDRKIQRSPLPGNTLGTFSMQVADVAGVWASDVSLGELPETMTVQLDKAGGKLVLKVDMK